MGKACPEGQCRGGVAVQYDGLQEGLAQQGEEAVGVGRGGVVELLEDVVAADTPHIEGVQAVLDVGYLI